MLKQLAVAVVALACCGVANGAGPLIFNWDIDTDPVPGPDDAAGAIVGAHEPAGAAAFGIVGYNGCTDETLVLVLVGHFTANTGYFVTLSDGVSDMIVGGMFTDVNGHACFYTYLPGDFSGKDIRLFNQNFGPGVNPPDNDPSTGTNLTATGIN